MSDIDNDLITDTLEAQQADKRADTKRKLKAARARLQRQLEQDQQEAEEADHEDNGMRSGYRAATFESEDEDEAPTPYTFDNSTQKRKMGPRVARLPLYDCFTVFPHELPPFDVALSDWHLAQVVQMRANGEITDGQMKARWPEDFTSDGNIATNRAPRGTYFVVPQPQGLNTWVYARLQNRVLACGDKGLRENVPVSTGVPYDADRRRFMRFVNIGIEPSDVIARPPLEDPIHLLKIDPNRIAVYARPDLMAKLSPAQRDLVKQYEAQRVAALPTGMATQQVLPSFQSSFGQQTQPTMLPTQPTAQHPQPTIQQIWGQQPRTPTPRPAQPVQPPFAATPQPAPATYQQTNVQRPTGTPQSTPVQTPRTPHKHIDMSSIMLSSPTAAQTRSDATNYGRLPFPYLKVTLDDAEKTPEEMAADAVERNKLLEMARAGTKFRFNGARAGIELYLIEQQKHAATQARVQQLEAALAQTIDPYAHMWEMKTALTDVTQHVVRSSGTIRARATAIQQDPQSSAQTRGIASEIVNSLTAQMAQLLHIEAYVGDHVTQYEGRSGHTEDEFMTTDSSWAPEMLRVVNENLTPFDTTARMPVPRTNDE